MNKIIENDKFNFILNHSPLKESMTNPMVDPDFFADSFANSYFPVLEGTPYEKEGYSFPKDWFTIYDCIRKKILIYEENCNYMLSRPLKKEMFHDHSLFLIKESLKVFSPYCEKAKELLQKLERLE